MPLDIACRLTGQFEIADDGILRSEIRLELSPVHTVQVRLRRTASGMCLRQSAVRRAGAPPPPGGS